MADEGTGVASDVVAPNVFFRSRPTKMDLPEAAERISAALRDAFGAAAPAVEVDGDDLVLRWEDGPAAATVADAVATVVNWEVRAPGQPAERPGPAVLVARTFSDAALAVAVVRHRGCSVRPYDSTNAAAVATLSGLLEVDSPGRSGYPVVDAMATLLLDAPDPAGLAVPEDATRADRLSLKLVALGYDALWARAWSTVT